MVDDVVTVCASRASLQPWRRIHVADAEPREVAGEFARVFESKVLVELQAIGGAWNHSACPFHRGAPEHAPGLQNLTSVLRAAFLPEGRVRSLGESFHRSIR